jgi:hypothetical protein
MPDGTPIETPPIKNRMMDSLKKMGRRLMRLFSRATR